MRIIVFFLIIAIPSLFGADFYASPQGDDSNSGKSLKTPWKTITRALESLSKGDTLYLMGGVYPERVEIRESGAPGKPIRILAYKDQTPIIDGGAIEVQKQTGLIDIEDSSYVTIQGLDIRNFRAEEKKKVPIGILVTGVCHHIEIRKCKIYAIETIFDEKMGGDAHGIAVLGNQKESIHDLIIDSCTLSDLKLGSSEALVLNGNVENFKITNNVIHDCNNIAIDFIGFEETAPEVELDQARNGICEGNVIYNIDTFGNPAYGEDRSAGGIYIDGGRDILVSRNRIWNCNLGIELASEHKGCATSNITVRNNLIYQNHIGGIFMGGYNKKRGSTEHCVITNNTLYKNDQLHDGNGELFLQFDVKNNVIQNNIFVCNDQNLLIGNPFEENENNLIDYNLYYSDDDENGENVMIQWQKEKSKSWAEWIARGNDQHSIFQSPGFEDPSTARFTLKSGSPCINRGNPDFTPAKNETDFVEKPRRQGGRVDLGAYEVK